MKKITLVFLLSVFVWTVAVTAQRQGKAPSTNAAAAKNVTISNFQFTPKTITIKAGGTVTWTNKEGTHTVTADDNSWESPNLNAGKTFSRQFASAGTYRYHCSFHGSPGGDMSGVVNVIR
jgi:plastocyanin